MAVSEPFEATGTSISAGVGPWAVERPGQPRPSDVRFDPELLDEGDRRNVLDGYRYWTVEAIRADLDTRRHPIHVAIENWQHDFNIGSVVRTANGFNVAGVHVVGRRRWNRRGAMVTDRYLHLHHHQDVASLVDWAGGRGLPLIGLDTGPGTVPIESATVPREVVLLFGQEGPGLSPEAVRACDRLLSITQYGSTRSLNAGAAAAIALFAWATRHAGPTSPAAGGAG